MSFVRETDRASVMSAVADSCRRRAAVREISAGRTIIVDPIMDDLTGIVHGVWFRIASVVNLPTQPAAWAFTWDLDFGIARRCPIVGGGGQTWESLGIDTTRSLASGLSHLDMGSSIEETLAKLVASVDGTSVQKRAIENRPDGSSRNVQIFGQFFTNKVDGSADRRRRVVRGVSVDLGDAVKVGGLATPNLDEQVVRAIRPPNQNLAVLDPWTCEILYWYGPAPAYLEWKGSAAQDGRPVLHIDDLAVARKAFAKVSQYGEHATEIVLRFLSKNLQYVPVTLSISPIDLGCTPSPVLAVFK